MTDELTYVSYLQLKPLLALQQLRSTPEHPDELLFIVVHQASELWFKLILHELHGLAAFLEQANALKSLEAVQRINILMGIVTAQLQALDTLSPHCFAQFRTYLGTSSGSQSFQFRAIELISGLRDPDFLAYLTSQGPLDPIVQEALDRTPLPELFNKLLQQRGVKEEQIYATEDYLDLRMLAEGLLTYDQAFGVWRFLHVQMVERIIGPRTVGTGGSLGAKALRDTLNNRFFPELWEVRAKFFTA